MAATLRGYAKAQPEATTDTGNTEFLELALNLEGRGTVSDHQALRGVSGERCEAVLADYPTDFRKALLALLGPDAEVCNLGVTAYDARDLGGFFVITNVQGSMGCAAAQVIRFPNGTPSLGPALRNEGGMVCWDSTFHVIQDGTSAFPAVLERLTHGPELRYQIIMLSPEAALMDIDRPLCTVEIAYRPKFMVAEWLGPNGKDDVARDIEDKIAPILLRWAAGKDAADLVEPLRDRPEGTSLYDAAIAAPDSEQAKNWLPREVPFAQDGPTRPYTGLDPSSYAPLRIGDRRLLIGFGVATFGWREWNDSAFGIWEWKDGALQPIAGGYMGKSGSNPEIKEGP